MALNLEGKIAIVTGASRGIGAATARLLAEEGAKVVLLARGAAELDQVAQQIRRRGGVCEIAPADVVEESAVQAAFNACRKVFGPVDILINNAGMVAAAPFEEMPTELWDRTIAVNLRGMFLCSREAFRQMKGRGGVIVNISSLAGIRGLTKFPNFAAYTAAKSAVVGFTEALATEGKPEGIRVNAVAPGAVDTEMLRQAAPGLRTRTRPEDIAQSILFLADDQRSRRLTGTILEIHSNE